jgi:hypothetical protein
MVNWRVAERGSTVSTLWDLEASVGLAAVEVITMKTDVRAAVKCEKRTWCVR